MMNDNLADVSGDSRFLIFMPHPARWHLKCVGSGLQTILAS